MHFPYLQLAWLFYCSSVVTEICSCLSPQGVTLKVSEHLPTGQPWMSQPAPSNIPYLQDMGKCIGSYHISLNEHTCLNKGDPLTFDSSCHISGTSEPILITFSTINIKVLRRSCCQFHGNQTRLNIRLMPLRLARLFGEIRYSSVHSLNWKSATL